MKAITSLAQHASRKVFRTIEVPDDLTAITDTDGASEVDPRKVQLSSDAVENIWQACETLYRSGVYPMMSLCLRRQGEIVLNRSLGFTRDDRIASLNTPVCLFSASKAVTAVLMHLLAEQGKVNLLNPVSYYIPAFAANGKGSISIHELLAHRGGIPTVPDDVDLDLLYDHDAALQLLCAAEPNNHQAGIQAYHAITSGFIFNEIIRVTTGLNAQQYLDKYIRKPMGMRYFRYGLTQREQSGVAINSSTGLNSRLINHALKNVLGAAPDTVIEMTNDPRFYRSVIPSVNLFATAEEVSRFYQMLLNHGHWQGKQIIDPLTVHRAIRPLGKMELDKTLKVPMRYSAGFMLGGNPVGIFGRDTQYAYGHLGYANIFCWADPERDIAVSLLNSGKPVLGPHVKALPLLLGAISAECSQIIDMANDVPIYQRHSAARQPR